MFFHKYPHPANFRPLDRFDAETGLAYARAASFSLRLRSFEGDLHHLTLAGERWPANQSLLPLNEPAEVGSVWQVSASADLSLPNGVAFVPGRAIGVSGPASLFQIQTPPDAQFFGLGEKNYNEFELSGYRSRFWNTDVWSDFHWAQWGGQPTDPSYFNTPYVLVRTSAGYTGFLLHNPYPAFVETPGIDESRVFVEWQRTAGHLVMGSDGGEPNLWVIQGETMADVTRKLQRLVGVTPTPPLWALGYHQSRWGYGGHDDLLQLDARFNEHKIPCDALWMDLDYMDGYRIFTTSEAAFPDGVTPTLAALAESNRRIVPIIDPGVKKDPGYPVYDDGLAQNVFCQNPNGDPYVGLVWPGETVFPDFTLPEVRAWWAGYARRFREEGYGGCWVDMNDPSTGPVDPDGMLFRHGQDSHAAHRNQYGLGMQMATFEGFLAARPNERPFILSRSGTTGSSQYAAIWTGDNVSNRFYLAMSIPTSLGLSISGVPFNGPDMGGFGGDVTDDLMVDWVKAGFLFPFLRNHCDRGRRPQEPFNLPAGIMNIVRRYIRLRYKLLPYLYQLFVAQEETGDPVMRPLLYEFESDALTRTKDQFMVGPWLMQAPILEEGAKAREVLLPGEEPWYHAMDGTWAAPGTVRVRNSAETTPLFVRAGAMIPMQPGAAVDNRKNLNDVQVHVFVPKDWSGSTKVELVADDGLSFDYRSGARTRLRLELASVAGHVAIQSEAVQTGFGVITPTYVVHGPVRSLRVNGEMMELRDDRVVLTGRPLRVSVAS